MNVRVFLQGGSVIDLMNIISYTEFSKHIEKKIKTAEKKIQDQGIPETAEILSVNLNHVKDTEDQEC